MSNRVIVCGGGFGGIAAARRLRALRPDDEVVLIDQGTTFQMGFRKVSTVVGGAEPDEGARPLSALEAFGIRFVNAPITAIDPAARAVEAGGERLEGDALIVALGAETVPGAVPGLAEHGIDVYSRAGAARAREAFASFDAGRLVVGIFGAPYKCPPAPFELALLLNEAAQARGGRRVELEVFTPLPMSLPVIGRAGCEVIEGRILGQLIGFRREAKAARVEPGKVVLADGDEIAFDLLFAVPPHRVPQVVVDAGLAEQGGWVKADPRTLETSFDGVYALGDMIAIQMPNGMPMPKSGVFADGEGIVAAEGCAARLEGREPGARFEGEGACFLEVGNGEAMLVRGRFLAEPAPEVELTTPSAAHLEEKRAFEASKLAEWFG